MDQLISIIFPYEKNGSVGPMSLTHLANGPWKKSLNFQTSLLNMESPKVDKSLAIGQVS